MSDKYFPFKEIVDSAINEVFNQDITEKQKDAGDNELQSLRSNIDHIHDKSLQERVDIFSNCCAFESKAKQVENSLDPKHDYKDLKTRLAFKLVPELANFADPKQNYWFIGKVCNIFSSTLKRAYYVAGIDIRNSLGYEDYATFIWGPNDGFPNNYTSEDAKANFVFVHLGFDKFQIFNQWSGNFLYCDTIKHDQQGVKGMYKVNGLKRCQKMKNNVWILEKVSNTKFRIKNEGTGGYMAHSEAKHSDTRYYVYVTPKDYTSEAEGTNIEWDIIEADNEEVEDEW